MILEHVNHPFLVNLAYAFQTPTQLFFIMIFMKGGELFQHLRMARKFDEKRAKFYTSELILGLGHLHSKDIVYRDLKLENILMDDLGNVFLTDFGMAKIVRKNELAMTFCGTPEYLCPEVILGYGCDRTADWWSLGILTYEMMYGLPPFYNKNQTIMFKLIKEGELRFPERPETSKEAKDFISRCLIRDRT
jgi:serum/glucocorticoid-regulated kinase 2